MKPPAVRTGVSNVGVQAPARGVTDAEAPDALEEPAALVAVTVNVYAVPLVNPVTVQGELALEQVTPPGDAVTV